MQTGARTYSAHGFNDALPKGKASGSMTVTSQALTFKTDDKSVSMSLRGIEFKLGGASHRLLFASHPNQPDWSVYTSDLSMLKDPNLQQIPSIKAQLSKARNRRFFNWSVLVVIIMVLLLVPFGLFTNMGWVSKQIAEEVPADWERSLGKTVYAQYKMGKQFLASDEGKAALNDLAMPLLNVVSQERYRFEIVVSNSQEVNAFALPGGYIVVNAGLILTADNASEVLGVLAHEMSHVTEQHGLRNVINTAGVFLLVDALLGDVSGVLAMLTNAAPLLINQSYSRQFEAEADAIGLQLLAKARIDPSGFVNFFEKMIALEQKQLESIEDQNTRELVEDAMGFLSTHPATEERIENIEAMMGQHQGPFENYDIAFKKLQNQVKKFVANNNEENL
ncbi:MAG: M48 family metallopeptidase [Pseudomonadales bacterium]|nr:M48 family metallopeptidase [Pseudomonadales bacterium]